jgi:putative ubiquitin-RnfH superfamily antitoxin RatB of RatAB toxin-antitoxin module
MQKKALIYLIMIEILLLISFAHAVQLKQLNVKKSLEFNISGTFQTIVTKSEIDILDEDIDIHRFRLGFSGKLDEHVSFFSEFEMGANISPDEHWKATPANRMKILDQNPSINPNTAAGARYAQKDFGADSRLVQAYVDLKYFKKITLRIGQIPRGSSYELNTPVNKLETINYSTSVGWFGKYVRSFQLKMAPFKFLKIGIGVDDSVGGITGGINTPKAKISTGGKVVLIPWPKHLSFKLCARHVSQTNDMPDANAGIIGADFKYKGFHFQGEMYHIHVNPVNMNTGKGLKGNVCSWYVHASYIIPTTKIQLVTRYNFFEKRMRDRRTDTLKTPKNYDMEIITAGVNYSFSPNSRLQIMYDALDGKDNDCLDIQLELSF